MGEQPHPQLITLTQEELDRRIATAVLAVTRSQYDAAAQASRVPTRVEELPPAGTRQQRDPPEDLRAPSRRPQGEANDYEASVESAAEQTPSRDFVRGKRPETGEVRGPENSPFVRRILDEEVPRQFRMPQFPEYTGNADPEDHLGRFENAALLHRYTDAIKCRVFLTTLAGSALRWFNRLPQSSIRSFADFKGAFLRHFATSKTYRKTIMDLFATKQKTRESLKEFVHRFNQVAQEVPAASSDVLVNAFSQGLTEGDFFRSIIKRPPENFDVLLSRADKYIHVEEAQAARRREAEPGHGSSSHRNAPPAPRAERKPAPQLLHRSDLDRTSTPTKHHQRTIHEVANQPSPPGRNSRWAPKFCAYHQSRSHDTNECHQYAKELRLAADQRTQKSPHQRQGRPAAGRAGSRPRPPSPRPTHHRDRSPRRGEQASREEAPRDPRSHHREDSPGHNQNNPTRGTILMITGGATDGDSHRARKAHSRQLEVCGVGKGPREEGPIIGFGPQDLEGVETPHDDALVVHATIANYNVARVFVDTGSSVNIIFLKAFAQMQIDKADLSPMTTSLFGFTGNEVRPLGQITLAISLGEEPLKRTRRVPFTIVDAPSVYNVILGRPTLSAFSAVVSTYHQKMKFPVGDQVGESRGDQLASRKCYVDMVRTEARKNRKVQDSGIHSVQEAPSMTNLEEKETLQVCPDRADTVVQIAADLPPELKESLGACLLRNQDVFAWSTEDLTGVPPSIAVHRLNVLPDSRPVKQKRRHFGPEQNRVIREEVQKLLKAGHIKEVHFPTWLSNVVLVPKPNNKWRVCVDFRDLNKACPKDCYPLPRIDQLVDSTAGFEYICMLDAYQGYHQIPLDVTDQDKGATYQRLMDRVFQKQQGRNIEVYVDDILIKSARADSLIADIEETCSTLRQFGLKLNPAKCLFGVRAGKFLGYIVTEKGIEANPEKLQALAQMAPPRNLREAQKLVGRIMALSRFISHSAGRSLPFFKVLRKAQKFQWNADCDRALEELKAYLTQLPRLAKALPGEPLLMYLSTTEAAVSSVLVKEEEQGQQPVYFFSRLLKDAETRYTSLEKLAWTVVLSTRRLRPYFLSHPVTVLTNSNLGKVLTQPEFSGRLAKWTMELSQYDIRYQPRVAIKAQALADFLAEAHQGKADEEWKAYVDGAANKQGSGVGVVLVSPQGEEIRLAVRLGFRASNNEAEYEAVLMGLRAAKRVGATRVQLLSDSQLVSQQVEGNYEIKNERLRRYAEVFAKLKTEFEEVTLSKIPRGENSKADELAKLASSVTEWTEEKPITQVAWIAQIDQPPRMTEPDDWRKPILTFLQTGEVPGDPEQARLLKRRATRFTLIGEQLYRRSFSRPLLKCLGPEDAEYVLKEAHQGCCGNHAGGRSLARKVLLAGYFWPTLQSDAAKLVSTCLHCQKYQPFQDNQHSN
ncbi:uncharacterized protein LOC141833939 [Curcuma longa]|uniref:uncharacterized protein LOC141833939 n=1 Tax=Curcuma longa TaxID=136217 RepID=UPI003D9E959B